MVTKRKKPGTGGGNYYRISVRPSEDFVIIRNQDVGEPGHLQRVAGRRADGSWDDQGWLIGKEDAHVEDDRLVADTAEAQKILDTYGPVEHLKGDTFSGHPRKNIPEGEKPTPAQQRARRANIRKAQATVRQKTIARS